jgi:hypothetical protein
VAARTAQAPEVLTPAQALAFVARHGIVCEASRRDPVPNLAEAIAGTPLRGSWWAHRRARTIFALSRAVRAAPQVLVCRLVDGRVTFVHERLWPALVRLADRLPHDRLARLREVHRDDGRHEVGATAFPDWVPAPVLAAARRLDEREAGAALHVLLEV